ncbi:hypothetical protein BOTBODRAFT_27163 [Botryobasidium botryosum FD-172 SS1]|uniref:Uncharacterized protein n=1 Tax=Botryobasidium botryosum (strain FD-172 SS1) TaxID=930990 RepID=A0A067MVG7_BOTB1|nr:hypothetical protein BOTBODRAFT_27163 [Botryobasidium botryosum FD-172 SS1]
MKDLVERALLPNPPSSIPEKALQDVLKMRKYVDEQAREVFSEGFQEIVQIQPMTDQELKEWREERRIMRRKKMEEKKERAALELRQKAEEEERQRQAAGDVERAKRHKEKEARRARKVARREERARRMAAGLPVEPSRKRRRPADGDDERAGRKRARVVVDGTGVDKAHRRSKRSADGAHLSADGQRRRRRRKQHATQHPGTRGIPTVPYPSQPVPSSATKGKRRADDGAAPHPKRHCTNDWATPHIPDDNDNLTLRFDWDVPASTPAYTPASGTTTAVASPDATWTMHGADARNMSCTWPAASQAPLLNSGSTAMAGATPRSTETELGFDYWKQALSHMKQSATPEAAVFEVELPSEDHHYHQSVTPEPQSQHHSQTPHHSQSQSHSHSQERLENPHPRSAGDFPDYLDKISEYSGTGRSSQCATPVSSEDIFAPEPIPPYSSDDASSQPSSRAPSPRTGTYGLPPISEGYSVSEGTPSVSSHSHSRSSRQQGQQEQHQHQHQHQQGHDRQQRHVSQQPQLHQHPNPHHSHPHSHSQPPPSSQPRSHSQPHSHSQPQQQHQQQRHPLPPMPSFPSLPPLPSLPSLPPLPPLPPPPPPPPPASDDLHPDEIRRLFSQQAQFAARQAEHAKQQMELYHKAVMEWEERAAQMALRVNDPYLMSQAGMAAGAGGAAAGTGGPGGGGGEGVSY